MKTVLLAVTGLSPAIVTETVWALAHKRPRLLPTRVVCLTTATGAIEWEKQILSPLPEWDGTTVWQALREALGAGPDELIAEPPRIIATTDRRRGTLRQLGDIVTPGENQLAASFILEEVRRIVENPDLRLVASIAGGRKTMGALLHAAVTLIGRESDRITHVLVPPPYDTVRGFYFPAQPGGPLRDREGGEHLPADARVHLTDVPFVPLRNRFVDLKEMPGNFDGLVRKFSREIKQDAARPHHVEIDYPGKALRLDGEALLMRPGAIALFHFLLWLADERMPIASQKDLAAGFAEWLDRQTAIPPGLKPQRRDLDDTWVRHELSHLRTSLEKIGYLIPRRRLALPPTRWTLTNA